MIQINTILAHQDTRQLRIMGHMVIIQPSKDFKLSISSSLNNSTDLYKAIIQSKPDLVIMEESLFTPCINFLTSKTDVILITANRTRLDAENIHYVYLPVQPVNIMQKISEVVSTSPILKDQDSRAAFANSTHFPEEYSKAIDFYVEKRHYTNDFGIDYIEQRHHIQSGLNTGEFSLADRERDHADTSFDASALVNPALRDIIVDMDDQDDVSEEQDTNTHINAPTDLASELRSQMQDFRNGFEGTKQEEPVAPPPVDPPVEMHEEVPMEMHKETSVQEKAEQEETFEQYTQRMGLSQEPMEPAEPSSSATEEVQNFSPGNLADLRGFSDDDSEPDEEPETPIEEPVPEPPQATQEELFEEEVSVDSQYQEPASVPVSEVSVEPSVESFEESVTEPEPIIESVPVAEPIMPVDIPEAEQSDEDSMGMEEEVPEDDSELLVDDVVDVQWATYPSKTIYAIGEPPEVSDGSVYLTRSDGSHEEWPLTDDMVYGVRFTQEGEQKAMIDLFGFTVWFSVTYTALRLRKIRITNIPKNTYIEGERLNISGLKMEKVFSDGSTAPLTNYQYRDVPLTCDMKTVTFSYGKKTAHLFLLVLPNTDNVKLDPKNYQLEDDPIKTIKLRKIPKQRYFVGDSLDVVDGVVVLIHRSGKKQTVPMTESMVSGFDGTKPGIETLTVSYAGFTTSYQVSFSFRKGHTPPISSNLFKTPSVSNLGEKLRQSAAVEPKTTPTKENSPTTTPPAASPITHPAPSTPPAPTKTPVPISDKDQKSAKAKEKKLVKISFANENRKSQYADGERITRSDYKILAEYDDGTKELVRDFEMAPEQFVSTADTEILISYKGIYLSSPITVSGKQLIALMLDAPPDKTTYVIGDREVDMTGAKVTLFYTDQSFESVSVPNDWVSGFDGSKAGTQVVSITHLGKSTNFSVTVLDREVELINITKHPSKLKYNEGEIFDPTGMEVSVKYNDGYTGERAPFSVSKEPLKCTDTNVNVYVGNKYAQVFIEVAPSTIQRIEMESLPYKMTYLEGEREFDPAGGLVAKYSTTGQKDIVPLSTLEYSGFNSFHIGACPIVVSIGNCVCEFEVRIVKKELENLSVASSPLKTIYEDGDAFDPTGLVLLAEYNDGSKTKVTDFSVVTTFLGPDDSFAVVKYENKMLQVPVTVTGRQVESIAIAQLPDKVSYCERKDPLDLTGAKLMVIFADSTSALVDITDKMVSGFDNTVIGDNILTVRYGGLSVEMKVQITAVELLGISIQRNPDKMAYNVGDFFDQGGMEVVAFYENGSRQLLKYYSVQPNRPLKASDNSVMISYMNKSVTLPITVNDEPTDGDSDSLYPDTMSLRFGE